MVYLTQHVVQLQLTHVTGVVQSKLNYLVYLYMAGFMSIIMRLSVHILPYPSMVL